MTDPGEELGQMDHDELLEEVVRLRAELKTAGICVEAADKRTEVIKKALRDEVARCSEENDRCPENGCGSCSLRGARMRFAQELLQTYGG
jgi:hypothetical protein